MSRTPSGSGRSAGGSSRRPSASSSARISRAKNALPSVRAWTASASSGAGSMPLVSAMSSPTSSLDSPPSTSRRPARTMFESAVWASRERSGTRSCIVTSSSTATSRSMRDTKSSATSDPSSTACRSSIRTTTGASTLRARSSDTSASNSVKRAISDASAPPSRMLAGVCAAGRRSASSGARRSSSSAAGPRSRRSVSPSTSTHRLRTTSTHGQYAGAARPQPRVQMTVAPSADACSASAAARRVLPTPGSPRTSWTPPRPLRASPYAARSSSSSRTRPTSGPSPEDCHNSRQLSFSAAPWLLAAR